MPRRLPLGPLLARAALESSTDLTSVTALARSTGLPLRTLQAQCKRCGTQAKECLAFLRCVRALVEPSPRWDPVEALAHYSKDDRTIERVLIDSGFDSLDHRPTLEEFAAQQHFIPADLSRAALVSLTRRVRGMTSADAASPCIKSPP